MKAVLINEADSKLRKTLKFKVVSNPKKIPASGALMRGMVATVLATCYARVLGVVEKKWIHTKPEQLLAALHSLDPSTTQDFEQRQTLKISRWFMSQIKHCGNGPYPLPYFGLLEFMVPGFTLESQEYNHVVFNAELV